MKRIVFLRSTSIKFEPVIRRKALVSRLTGLEPVAVYWDRKNQRNENSHEDHITYIPICVGRTTYGAGIFNLYKRFLFSCKVVGKLRSLKPSLIHACDLDTVIPAIIYKYLFSRDTKIIYDILDFIYTFSSPIPRFIRVALKKADRLAMAISDLIIIPDENRLDLVPPRFHSKTRVIYNAPDINFCYLPRRSEYDCNDKRITLLYVGGMSSDRGIKILLDTVKDLPERVTLTIGGQGELADLTLQYSKAYENIKYIGQVEYERVLELTSGSDILYAVYNPDSTTNKFASPNKFFEAVAYGKPIIVASGTSVDEKVADYDMGYVIDYEEDSLRNSLLRLNREELRQKGVNATRAFEKYNWNKMKNELEGIYSGLSG